MPNSLKSLLPCPFCGGEAYEDVVAPHTHTIATFMPDYEGGAMVCCSKCHAANWREGANGLELAITAWNTRAPIAEGGGDGEYSQGVMGDGAAILHNGIRMTIDEIVAALNRKAAIESLSRQGGEVAVAYLRNEYRTLHFTSNIRQGAKVDQANIYADMAINQIDRELRNLRKSEAASADTVEEAIAALVDALVRSKSWLHDYADAIVRDAIDRHPTRASEAGDCDAIDAAKFRIMRDSWRGSMNLNKGYLQWFLPRKGGGFMSLDEHLDSLIAAAPADGGG